MDISKQIKRYFSIFFGLTIVVFIIYIASKQKKFSCDEWANGFKEDFHCNIILTGKDFGGGIATLSGIELKTKKNINNEDGSKWLIDNFDKFKIGDTIIKNKGEYTILIKRKGEKILIPFTCNDKIYKDK